MECTLQTSKGKTIRVPLEHGYTDMDAIREAREKDHRIFHWVEGYWEATIDLDAKKVLRVMNRTGTYSGI